MSAQTTLRPYESEARPGRDGFPQLLHAEWTKLRTVRGWLAGLAVAGLVTVLIGVVGPLGSHIDCRGPNGQTSCLDRKPPIGPVSGAVIDSMTLVHKSLTGDGTLTARITSLTGRYPNDPAQPGGGWVDSTLPWSKAGIIVKNSLTVGSSYAAMLVTGDHGVRMQDDYIHDKAGLPGAVSPAAPRWLRLVRSGDTITGYDSADGSAWTEVGTAKLGGLLTTVDVGLFSASPEYDVMTSGFGGTTGSGGPSYATGVFDSVAVQGDVAGGAWTSEQFPGSQPSGHGGLDGQGGAPQDAGRPTPGSQESAGTFTVIGTGDIAPLLTGRGGPIKTVESGLVGAFAGLIAAVVVAAMFMTSEYRRGLIRTTLTASPRRGRVLAAKSLVIGATTFVVGLVACAVAEPLATIVQRRKGFFVANVPTLVEFRVIVGTAALLAVAAVFAVAIGCVVRRSAAAVAAVIVVVVLPYILAVASVLPAGPAEWLTRVTPAAAFAIQQTSPQYSQVTGSYTPADGYFPLAPWAGFAVLCAYTAAALALAAYLLRRRDA